MTMNSASIARHAHRPAARKTFSLIGWLLEKDSAHRNMARFARMDDRMLRDIGLTRSDRDREVARHTHGSVTKRHR